MTRQRQVIHDFLVSTKSHPTAEEIFAVARKTMPNIAFGTVYRNLSLMVNEGEVRKIPIPDAPDRFDGNTEIHDHMRCEICKRIFDIPRLGNINAEKSVPSGTVVLGCEVTVRCICSDCREKKQQLL